MTRPEQRSDNGLPFAMQSLEVLDQAAYQRWVSRAAVATGIGYALVALAGYLLEAFDVVNFSSEAFTTLVCFIAAAAAHRGRVNLAAGLVIGAVWLELHISIAQLSMHATAMMVFPALVVATGLLLGGRFAGGIAAVTAVTVPGAAWIGQVALGVPPGSADAYYAVVLAVVMLITAGLVHMAMATLGMVLGVAQAGEERVRELLNHAPDGVVALSGEGRILSTNPAAESLLGIKGDEVVGSPAAEVLCGRLASGGECSAVDRLLTSADEVRLDVLGADGRLRWVEARSTHFTSGSGRRGTQLTLHDATQRIRNEERERDFRRRLEESNRLDAVGRLAGGIAHDFNNHLTVIGGSAELVLATVEGENRRLIEGILESKSKAATLTKRLLAFARREIIQPRRLDLDGVLQDTLPLLRSLVGGGVTVELELREPPAIMADRSQVEHVLVNLLTNAKDALGGSGVVAISTSPPGATTRPRVGAGGVVPAGFVEIRVEDDGPGMDQEDATRAFEPFYTAGPFGERTGLGLATIHGIVTQNEGSVTIASEPGKGTSVRILWPVAPGG